MYAQLETGVRDYLSRQNNQQQAQEPVKPQAEAPKPDDLYSDPARWQQSMQQWTDGRLQQTLQQYGGPLLQAQAETAKTLTRGAHKEVFDRWGAEVEQVLQGVSPEQKANPAVWEAAVKVVRSNHVDEIAQERAQALAAEMGAGTEAGGSSNGAYREPAPTGFDKLAESEYGKRMIDQYGERTVADNCRKMGITVEQFAEQCAGTGAVAYARGEQRARGDGTLTIHNSQAAGAHA